MQPPTRPHVPQHEEPRYAAHRVQPTEGMAYLPPDVQARLLEEKRARMERTDTFGPVSLRRAKVYAAALALVVPLLLMLCAGVPVWALGVGVILGAAAGFIIGIRRSTPFESGGLVCLACLFTQLLPGGLFLSFHTVFTFAIYFVVGAIVGVHDGMRAADGQ